MTNDKKPAPSEEGFHAGISDEELDALLSDDIKSQNRPPKNLYEEDAADEQSEILNELISAEAQNAESGQDEVPDFFSKYQSDQSSDELRVVDYEDATTELSVVDFESEDAQLQPQSSSTPTEPSLESVDISSEDQDSYAVELEDQADLQSTEDDTPVYELGAEPDVDLEYSAPEAELSAQLESELDSEPQLDPEPVPELSSTQSDTLSTAALAASTVQLTQAADVATNTSTPESSPSNSFTTQSGTTIMSETQSAQIEQILAGIDELKRKLHGMSSDFYNAATDSATLISDIRELEVSSSAGQDFSSTYEQSRELRKNLVSSRKAFNVLASAIDELEEALEADLYAVQKG